MGYKIQHHMAAFGEQMRKKRSKFCPVPSAGQVSASDVNSKIEHIIPAGDARKVEGQKYLVLSYATPDGATKVRSPRGMVFKFSGAFPNMTAAEEHAAIIRNEDPRFDVFIVDMYVWGMVPMPDDEKPFIPRHYADEMLSRIVGGLQTSMAQGKKEMDERKARDRAKAEMAMRKVKGKDFKMPEKSEQLVRYETDQRKEREREEKAAHEESRNARITYTEDEITIALSSYCTERSITSVFASDFMKYLISKTVEYRAQMKRAHDREIGHQDQDPRKFTDGADGVAGSSTSSSSSSSSATTAPPVEPLLQQLSSSSSSSSLPTTTCGDDTKIEYDNKK